MPSSGVLNGALRGIRASGLALPLGRVVQCPFLASKDVPVNIKLSAAALRCRVSGQELEVLLSSRAVALELELPRNHRFRVDIKPALVGGWTLDSDPTGVWLSIPRDELEALSRTLPSRKGLEHAFELASGGVVRVEFEVDVRERS